MKKTKITLLCFIIFIMASFLIGCQNPTSSVTQDNTTNEGNSNESGDYPDGRTPGNGGVTIEEDGTVSITSRNVIYIGEETETIDSTTYLVKKYAELTIEDCPYFYIYYKFYYLNNKIRKVKVFSHGVGSDMDYKYTEFTEHTCGQNSSTSQIYTYHENGKLDSYIWDANSTGTVYRYENYFNQNGVKTSYLVYSNNSLYLEYEYYPNGQNKTYTIYNTDANPSYKTQKITYYEDGKQEYQIQYLANGSESYKTYYNYYNSGNKKTYEIYSNGKLSQINTYFDNNASTKKLYASYNSNEIVNTIEYYYSSEYLEYYYSSNYLYTYADNKTKSTSTNSSVYSNKQSYTDAQAKNLIQSLKN